MSLALLGYLRSELWRRIGTDDLRQSRLVRIPEHRFVEHQTAAALLPTLVLNQIGCLARGDHEEKQKIVAVLQTRKPPFLGPHGRNCRRR